jgi:hypothetical protein
MTLKLELSTDLESRLSNEATRLGLGLEQYVLSLLRSAATQSKSPVTGGELVAYWKREGLVGSRPEIADAPVHARSVREKPSVETPLDPGGRVKILNTDILIDVLRGHAPALAWFAAQPA